MHSTALVRRGFPVGSYNLRYDVFSNMNCTPPTMREALAAIPWRGKGDAPVLRKLPPDAHRKRFYGLQAAFVPEEGGKPGGAWREKKVDRAFIPAVKLPCMA